MRYEVGVNAHPPTGVTPYDVSTLSYVRFPVWQDTDYDYRPFIEGVLAQGMYVEVVCDRRFFPDNRWTHWFKVFKKRYPMVDWLQVCNEWDADPSLPSESWPLTNTQVSTIVRAARKVMGNKAFITLGDTISGDGPRRLAQLKCLDVVNAVGFAPYAARPSESLPEPGWGTATIRQVYDAHHNALVEAGYPDLQIECGEWGYKQSEVPDESVRAHTVSEMMLEQARLGIARGALYCLSEAQHGDLYVQGLESEAALFGAGAVIELPDPVHAPVVWNTQGEDIGPPLAQYSSEAGISMRLALACAIAESGLNPYAERWGGETARARQLINARDWGALQNLINQVWADVSFSYGQQIVLYHYEGDHSATVNNCLEVRAEVFENPLRSLQDMCNRLAAYISRTQQGDLRRVGNDVELGALLIYNAGSLRNDDAWWQKWGGNIANYRRAFVLADEILSQ